MLSASILSKGDLVLTFDIIAQIEKISTREEYNNFIPSISRLVPFGVVNHTLVECQKKDSLILKIRDNFHAGNCPTEWVNRYFDMGYGISDPVMINNLLGGLKIQRWKDTYKAIPPSKNFVMEAEDFGLKDGLTIGCASIRKPEFSIFSLSGEGVEYNERTKFIMERLINTLHSALSRSRSDSNCAELTTRQKQVLDFLKHGHPQKVIATNMGLSQDRIKAIISEIKNLMETENAVHSVYMATKYGEI